MICFCHGCFRCGALVCWCSRVYTSHWNSSKPAVTSHASRSGGWVPTVKFCRFLRTSWFDMSRYLQFISSRFRDRAFSADERRLSLLYSTCVILNNIFVSSWLGSCFSHLPASTAVPRRRLPFSVAHWPSSSLCWHQNLCRSSNRHSVRGQKFLNLRSKIRNSLPSALRQPPAYILLCLNNILNPTCFWDLRPMRLETVRFYRRNINPFYVRMHVCMYVFELRGHFAYKLRLWRLAYRQCVVEDEYCYLLTWCTLQSIANDMRRCSSA